MTVPLHKAKHTYEEYVALESFSPVKHEFLDGEIYAMAGGTPEHAALTAAFAGQLYAQLSGGPCRAYSSDLRIRTRSGLATYPDVTIICGKLEVDSDELSATNPILLVEVLSRSTEEYDAGDKFDHYKSLPSFRQYVLVSQRERLVEVWTREENHWTNASFRDGDIAQLSTINATVDVRELYDAAAG